MTKRGEMTPDRIQMLAHLACASRPNGAPVWDEPGVVAMIRKLHDRGFGMQAVIDRVFAHAWDAEAKTPGVLLTPKSRKPVEESTIPFPVRSRGNEPECEVHIGKPAGSCPACAADRLVGDTTPPAPRQDPPSYDEATGKRLRHRRIHELVAEHQALETCDDPNCHYHRFVANAPTTEEASA